MKKIVVSILFCVGMLFVSQSVLAADFDISCIATTCTPGTITGFFPTSEVWYPTKVFSQSILLHNTSGASQQITAEPTNFTEVQEGVDLAQVIQYTITRQSDNAEIWTGSLYSFYHSGGVNLLSALATNASDTFTFTGEMYATAGNDYQNRTTVFDLIITVITDDSSLSPTSTPVCTTKAAEVPGALSLSPNNSNEVKVTWGTVGGATGYEISWGTNSNTDDKGSKSVGITSETTIGGLDLNSNRYYFKVRSVKDCAKSDWNGIRSTGTGTDLLASPTSTSEPGQNGFSAFVSQGFVEGAQTNELTPIPTLSPRPTGTEEVKGVSTTNSCNCIWWQLLLGEALVAALYFWKFGKNMSGKKYGGSMAIGVLAPFLLFRYLNKCLTYSLLIFPNTPSITCKYFIGWEILILIAARLIASKLGKKEELPS